MKEIASIKIKVTPSVHRKISRMALELAKAYNVPRVTLGETIDYLLKNQK